MGSKEKGVENARNLLTQFLKTLVSIPMGVVIDGAVVLTVLLKLEIQSLRGSNKEPHEVTIGLVSVNDSVLTHPFDLGQQP